MKAPPGYQEGDRVLVTFDYDYYTRGTWVKGDEDCFYVLLDMGFTMPFPYDAVFPLPLLDRLAEI